MNQHFKPDVADAMHNELESHIAGIKNLQSRLVQLLSAREQRYVAETARLKDRIDNLEGLLGLKEKPDLIPIVGCRALRRITPIIKLFAARDLVSKLAVSLAIDGDHLSDQTIVVYIYHAKAALKTVGINVQNDRGRGWYLKPDDKAKLKKLLAAAADQYS